jgi:hypothetical protein
MHLFQCLYLQHNTQGFSGSAKHCPSGSHC